MSGDHVVGDRWVDVDGSLCEVVLTADGCRTVCTPGDEAIERLKARNLEIRALLDAMVTRHPELKATRRLRPPEEVT